jgi:hypothetical protein
VDPWDTWSGGFIVPEAVTRTRRKGIYFGYERTQRLQTIFGSSKLMTGLTVCNRLGKDFALFNPTGLGGRTASMA